MLQGIFRILYQLEQKHVYFLSLVNDCSLEMRHYLKAVFTTSSIAFTTDKKTGKLQHTRFYNEIRDRVVCSTIKKGDRHMKVE